MTSMVIKVNETSSSPPDTCESTFYHNPDFCANSNEAGAPRRELSHEDIVCGDAPCDFEKCCVCTFL